MPDLRRAGEQQQGGGALRGGAHEVAGQHDPPAVAAVGHDAGHQRQQGERERLGGDDDGHAPAESEIDRTANGSAMNVMRSPSAGAEAPRK